MRQTDHAQAMAERFRELVEEAGDIPGQFHVLDLVLADRHAIAVIDEDVRGLQDRIFQEAGVDVLHAIAQRNGSFEFKVDDFDWGGEYYKKHGLMMPKDGRDQIRDHDAILFGSAGHPDIQDPVS